MTAGLRVRRSHSHAAGKVSHRALGFRVSSLGLLFRDARVEHHVPACDGGASNAWDAAAPLKILCKFSRYHVCLKPGRHWIRGCSLTRNYQPGAQVPAGEDDFHILPQRSPRCPERIGQDEKPSLNQTA